MILLACGLAVVAFQAVSAQETQLGPFHLRYDSRGVTSLSGPEGLDVLASGRRLGDLTIHYRLSKDDWLEPYTDERHVSTVAGDLRYVDSPFGTALRVQQDFRAAGDALDWTVTLDARKSITVGDLGFSIPWHRPSGEDPTEIFEHGWTKHQFISGAGSFLYFTKASGQPPYLVVTTLPGTKLEYSLPGGPGPGASYRCFVLSAYSAGQEPRGTWRQPNTSLDLRAGTSATFGLRFQWARSYDEMREILYREGSFDIRVVPGMTLPSDLEARLCLHTRAHIESVEPEFPNQTTLTDLGETTPGFHLYGISFRRLGENRLTVVHDGGRRTYLEFFSTQPLEMLIKKRAHFIATKQQHRNPGKWFDGLYSVYDMRAGVLRGPDDTDGFDGWWGYVLACDDPALCKAPFLAEKNAAFPDADEIASLEYYIQHFVWGGIQRTDKETPFPYGVYGTPNWYVNRNADLRRQGRTSNLDKMHVWRSFDYPHIVMLYFEMYEIAKRYPRLVHYLDAKGYLRRSYETARAYFDYPGEILPGAYNSYHIGCYNEIVIPALIEALEAEGLPDQAGVLRVDWGRKVRHFVSDDKYPYGSEYPFDRTAFESTYALASYGATHDVDQVSRKDSRGFMERQLFANLACRGWLEAAYYLLGADFSGSSDVGCLSYMAAMGGSGILDFGLNFAEQPYDWLQLGYASYLSSWSLMNTGYWFPGAKNDGAAGWQFMPQKFGHSWARNKEEVRGPWHYDGEIDLGYGGALRMAATVATDDPIFGWFAYGGKLQVDGDLLEIEPRDGLRQRFDLVAGDRCVQIELDRDGFAADKPIAADKSFSKILAVVENRTGDVHTATLRVLSRGAGYTIRSGGITLGRALPGAEMRVQIPVGKSPTSLELVKDS